MDNHPRTQEVSDEPPMTAGNQRAEIALPTNANSWFRRRLDLVRSEARKENQLKSVRPPQDRGRA